MRTVTIILALCMVSATIVLAQYGNQSDPYQQQQRVQQTQDEVFRQQVDNFKAVQERSLAQYRAKQQYDLDIMMARGDPSKIPRITETYTRELKRAEENFNRTKNRR